MKKSVFLLVGAALLASCSQSDLIETPAVDSNNIVLKSSLSGMSVTTRAPFVDELSSSNPLTALVLASSVSNSYTSLLAKGTMSFTGGEDGVGFASLEAGDGKFVGTNAAYLRGFYPIDWNISGNVATYTLTGKDDVMFAPQVSTDKAAVLNRNYATLEFEHKLTKLELRFRADAASTITSWGKITNIELVKAAGTAPNSILTLDLSTSAAGTFGTTIASLPCYNMSMTNKVAAYTNTKFSGVDKLTEEAEYYAYTLPAPVNATAAMDNEYEFKITTSAKGEVSVKVDLLDKDGNKFVGSTAGYAFTVLFNFVDSYISASATVKEWNDGGESIVIVQ